MTCGFRECTAVGPAVSAALGPCRFGRFSVVCASFPGQAAERVPRAAKPQLAGSRGGRRGRHPGKMRTISQCCQDGQLRSRIILSRRTSPVVGKRLSATPWSLTGSPDALGCGEPSGRDSAQSRGAVGTGQRRVAGSRWNGAVPCQKSAGPRHRRDPAHAFAYGRRVAVRPTPRKGGRATSRKGRAPSPLRPPCGPSPGTPGRSA